jgi:hypothetical protein
MTWRDNGDNFGNQPSTLEQLFRWVCANERHVSEQMIIQYGRILLSKVEL